MKIPYNYQKCLVRCGEWEREFAVPRDFSYAQIRIYGYSLAFDADFCKEGSGIEILREDDYGEMHVIVKG